MNWIAAALFFLIGKGVLEMEGETIAEAKGKRKAAYGLPFSYDSLWICRRR